MRQEKKQKDRTAAALVLCFCLMALVSVFVVKASIDKVKDNLQSTRSAEVVKKKPAGKSDTSASKESIVDSRSSESDGENNNSTDHDFIMPVNGEVIMKYSADMPIYWPTLDQYMTHEGVDISAPEGTGIKACAGGTITKIDEDDRFGITMEINHGDGVISVYGNLSKDDMAELGQIVKKGDIIGRTGKTSMFEYDSPAHLHFEIKKDEEPADPGEYVPL